ncbi:pyridoxal phosphate-dependent aminotransferase [Chitinophaga sancti]|uniref:Histidinol-phosphate aminotransferase n=1 Tax=Chitinophaga sancti TaxID=1004 RepID=A0A1K1S1P3_9BACT|nr:histidinol-phosphate transaminase [Chitinophaga sancti]WQD59694.1 histidinol-phosphate transaminase [Chitinophaga sancti]WQG88175.1 histidinol-phosphate transaminase [Chitinophaga sancti]SFW78222.1 histidinol-phosphate aminotransferase [Chitinophaga sancti]
MRTTNKSINRREWLKTTALFTGGLTMLPGVLQAGALAEGPAEEASATFDALTLPGTSASSNLHNAERLSGLQADAASAARIPGPLKARLFANENPFGPSSIAKKAMIDCMDNGYQYPFMLLKDLEAKICAYEGIDANMLMTSAGSSPLLLGSAITLLSNGGNIVSADPTYDDLPTRCEKIKATWIKVPLKPDYTHDLDAMEKAITAETKLVYICNPNNPTGTIVDVAKLKDFCERVSKKVPVFVDEAYIDYLPDPAATTLIDGVKKGQNIIIARTFSKVYGLAGLRVGYVIAQPAMIELLGHYAAAGGYALSLPAITAALASYNDKAYIDEVKKKMEASKHFLYETLKSEGYSYIPSYTNFVMFPLKMEGQRFVEEMYKREVGLRNWKLNNQDWCRISIGRMDEMQAFATAFKELS